LFRLSHFIIGYMALAFSWWAYHLWTQNDLLLATQRAYLMQSASAGNNVLRSGNGSELTLEKAEQKWAGRRRMILGEGVFFIICLGIGMYFINRSVKKEISLAQQRRNFMLSITHELKSPLAGIRLIFETAMKRALSPPQAEQLYRSGLRDAERLQDLVDDLLLASRLEDNWKPFREALALREIVQEVIGGLALRYPEANIQVNIPADLPALYADKTGMISVFQNLLENALKYSPAGQPVTLTAQKNDKNINIAIADQGKGIADVEKKAIFQKFYRVGNEETRSATGTGLGLYIVAQVVKAHGGTIALTDNRPVGSVFTIILAIH
jgi:two-component system, OmpR family, phosphate regulon sensor histidine kinase PhoR